MLFRRVDEYVSVCLSLPVTLSGTDSCPKPLTALSHFKPLLFITLLECILMEYALYLAFLMHKNALHNLQSVERPRRKAKATAGFLAFQASLARCATLWTALQIGEEANENSG